MSLSCNFLVFLLYICRTRPILTQTLVPIQLPVWSDIGYIRMVLETRYTKYPQTYRQNTKIITLNQRKFITFLFLLIYNLNSASKTLSRNLNESWIHLFKTKKGLVKNMPPVICDFQVMSLLQSQWMSLVISFKGPSTN